MFWKPLISVQYTSDMELKAADSTHMEYWIWAERAKQSLKQWQTARKPDGQKSHIRTTWLTTWISSMCSCCVDDSYVGSTSPHDCRHCRQNTKTKERVEETLPHLGLQWNRLCKELVHCTLQTPHQQKLHQLNTQRIRSR